MSPDFERMVSQIKSFFFCPYQNSDGKTVSGNAALLHNIAIIGDFKALVALIAKQGYRRGQHDLRTQSKQQLYHLIG